MSLKRSFLAVSATSSGGSASVKSAPYNAAGNGTTDDTAAIQAAINAANTAGGGTVSFPAGTYLVSSTLTLYSRVRLQGAGRESTVIKLAAAANTDLLKSHQFDTLTGGNTSGGVQQVAIIDLTLDGNKTAQTAGTGACLKHYGAILVMERVIVRNARGDGIQSEWSNSALVTDGCEGSLTNVVTHNNTGNGISWAGPHDSTWTDCVSFQNNAAGYWIRPGAAIHVAQQCHSWGTNQTYAWRLETSTFLNGCQGEGASVAQLLVGANDCQVVGGKYFGFGPTAVGVQIGDATHTAITGTRLETMIQNCPGGHLDLTYSGGAGFIAVNIYGTGVGVIGNAKTNEAELITVGGGATGIKGASFDTGTFYGANAILVVGTNQKFNVNGSAGRVELVNGCDLVAYSDNFTTQTSRVYGATGAVRPGSTAGLGGSIFSGTGAPTIAGTAGDYYLRSGTPTTANQRIYICTATGAAGAATWVGIV
jgi:hypothetical protein